MCNRASLASDVIHFAMLPTQSILVRKRFVYRCHVTSNWPMKVHGMIFCIVPCNFYQATCICYHHTLRSPCVKMNTPTMNISSLTPKTKENHDFFNWETFLVSSYEQPIVSDFTLPVTRNLEIWCSTILSETRKKSEASATECWRTWTNHMTHHRRSSLNGAGIVD